MPNRFRKLAVPVAVIIAMMVVGQSHAQSLFNRQGAKRPPNAGPAVPQFDISVIPSDPAAKIAVVGESSILLGDVQTKVDAKIAEVTEKTGQEIPEDQAPYIRANLTRGSLSQLIQQKMLRESFLMDQVGAQSAEKRKEADQMMNQRARAMFMESEVPQLMKQYDTDDLVKLDTELRKKGSSLSTRRREFIDQMLGHLYIRSKVDRDPDVTLAEINLRYQQTQDKYNHPAKARWEQISILFEKHPNRNEAMQMIAALGSEAYYGGSMKSVAKKGSEEPFASDGGQHEWTEKGSLKSKVLDAQIFMLPIGKMSEIITDESGLHIIRVLEREPAGRTALSEVQDKIRNDIRQEKIAAAQSKVMEELKDNVPVWTIFPQDVPGAKPLRTSSSPSNQLSR